MEVVSSKSTDFSASATITNSLIIISDDLKKLNDVMKKSADENSNSTRQKQFF